MKTRTKIVLSSTIIGMISGAMAGWYSIPTMIAEWSGIIDYDFIDNYINNDFNPYTSTIKGVLIWSAISGTTIGILAFANIKTVDCLKWCWESRSQIINKEENNEQTPLLTAQINTVN